MNTRSIAFAGLLFVATPALLHAQDTQSSTTLTTTTSSDQDRTISWYMAHETERKARIQVCDNDPGHLKDNPDCINAKKADNKAGVNNFQEGVDNTIQGAANFFQGK